MMYTSAVLAFAASASAHMLLLKPEPFPTADNGPVDNSASNFPCRVTGPEAYSATTPTEVKAGEDMQVTFKGGATHGGGSCQFSITPDIAPTKDSQWKVIHSIIGGCLTDQPGNIGNDAGGTGATPATVKIPADLPDGQYTFSWSWLNKVGNREFYHNCAPISVTGGSGSDVKAALGGLPDMFVANIPRETCHTTEGQDFDFPNPGESVQRGASASPGSDLTGDCDAMTKMGAGNGQLGSPGSAPGGGNNSSPSATPSAEPTPVPTNPGGVFAPSASAAPQPSATPTPENPSTENPPATGNGTACDNEGAVVCIGSSQFGICDHGFAVPQALAAGMSCSNGAITRRSVRRFPRGHLARRHGSKQL